MIGRGDLHEELYLIKRRIFLSEEIPLGTVSVYNVVSSL